MKKLLKIKGINRLAKIGSVAALSFLVAGSSLGNLVSGAESVNESTSRLTVNVNDLRGMADFNTEQIREDLLRSAFYDAARRADWLGDYDFKYNSNRNSSTPGSLELNVLSWRRSPTGMYEFSVAANYWDADGQKVKLGTFQGMRTSLTVFNQWDVGDQFSASAQDAFRGTLRKLKSVVIES